MTHFPPGYFEPRSQNEKHTRLQDEVMALRIVNKKSRDEIERLTALKTPASRQLLNITKAALENAEAEIERLQGALGFAASVIKSGEPWTETCEREIGGALGLPRHDL